MEKKFRIFLMGALLVSLIIVTYFIIFNSFIEMFNLKLRDTLAILSSVFSLLSIIIAASIGIYVMNKNHIDAANRERQKYHLEDRVELNKVNMRFIDILSEVSTLLASIEADHSEKMNQFCIEILKEYYDLLIEHRLELIKFTQINNGDKYDQVVKIIRILLYDIRLTKANIRMGDNLGYEKDKIIKLLDATHENLYNYLEENYHDKDFIRKFKK